MSVTTQSSPGDSPGAGPGDGPESTAPRPARWRRLLGRVDPLLVVCSLAALAVYLPRGFDGSLYRDLGAYSYGAQQVAEGEAPYLAMVNRAGPLAQLLPGLGVVAGRLVGVGDVHAMRALFLVFSVVAVGLAYLVGRDVLGSRHAGVATAAALACFGGFVELSTYGPREKTPMVMFVLAAILAMVHRRWFTVGVFVALATLTWQPAFPAAITVTAVAALLGPKRLRSLGLVALGGLVPTTVVVASYLALDALEELLDNFLLINLNYAGSAPMLSNPAASWRGLENGYGLSLWVLLVGLGAAVLVGLGAVLGRPALEPPRRATVVGVAVGTVVAVVWTLNNFNGWPDAFLLLPFGAVGIGGLVLVLTRPLPTRVAVAVTAVSAAGGIALAASFGYSTYDDALVEERAEVRAVLRAVPPGSEMVSINSPQSLVLGGMEQEPRVQLYSPAVSRWLDDVYPGGVRGYGEDLLAPEPVLVATDKRPPHTLVELLEEDYVRIRQDTSATWWVRAEDRNQLKAVRTALQDHLATVEH